MTPGHKPLRKKRLPPMCDIFSRPFRLLSSEDLHLIYLPREKIMNSMSNNPHVTIIGSGVGGHVHGHATDEQWQHTISPFWKKPTILVAHGATMNIRAALVMSPRIFIPFRSRRRGLVAVYPPREEIHAYLSNLADKYHLRRNTRFNSELASASFRRKSQQMDAETDQW